MTHPADKNTLECKECGRTFSEWMQTILWDTPSDTYVEIDVPLDMFRYEWTWKMQRLEVLCKLVDERYGAGGRIKLKPKI